MLYYNTALGPSPRPSSQCPQHISIHPYPEKEPHTRTQPLNKNAIHLHEVALADFQETQKPQKETRRGKGGSGTIKITHLKPEERQEGPFIFHSISSPTPVLRPIIHRHSVPVPSPALSSHRLALAALSPTLAPFGCHIDPTAGAGLLAARVDDALLDVRREGVERVVDVDVALRRHLQEGDPQLIGQRLALLRRDGAFFLPVALVADEDLVDPLGGMLFYVLEPRADVCLPNLRLEEA